MRFASVRRWSRSVGLLAALALVAVVVPALPALAKSGDGRHGTDHGVVVIASGLNNPRDLAFGPGNKLYVAEAGTGGTLPIGPGEECDPGQNETIGVTGSISLISNPAGSHPSTAQVAGGLISVACEDGTQATGPDGISVHGNGGIYVIMAGTSAFIPPDAPSDPVVTAAQKQLGRLLKVTPSGHWKTVADVGGYNYVWTGNNADQTWAPKYYGPSDPQPQFPDTNPYAVLALPGHEYVVDAGANTVSEVRANGSLGDPLAYVENLGFSDSVPTCIDQGPDGALYVGTLAFGNGPAGANVYRIDPNAGEDFLTAGTHVWASGLTAITGCGFGPGGDFYVTQFDKNGDFSGAGNVVRIPFNHPDTGRTTYGDDALNFPGGFAADAHSIYVSNWSISPGSNPNYPGGQVVRISVS